MPAIIDAMKISSRIQPPPGDGRNHRKQPHSATPCDPAHRLQRPAQKALIFRIPLPATFSGPGPPEHRPDPGHPLPAPIPAACPLPPTWPSKRGSELGEADPPAHIEALNPRQHPVEKAASIPPKGFNPWRNLNFRGPLPLPGSLPIHHRPQKRVKLSCPPPSPLRFEPSIKNIREQGEDPPRFFQRGRKMAHKPRILIPNAHLLHTSLWNRFHRRKGTATRRLHHPDRIKAAQPFGAHSSG